MAEAFTGSFQMWLAHALVAGVAAALLARAFGLRFWAVAVGFGAAALGGWVLSLLWPAAGEYWKKLPVPRDVFLRDSSLLEWALGWLPSLATGAGGVYFFRRREAIPPWAQAAERVTSSRLGWILLGAAALIYLSFHVPLVEHGEYGCRTCGLQRHEKSTFFTKQTRDEENRFSLWVERRGGPHKHGFDVQKLESLTVWGKNLRVTEVAPPDIEPPDWGAILERLERLDLDRPFYAAFLDPTTRGRCFGAARQFNVEGSDAQVREWWQGTQERLRTPRAPTR